MWQYKNPKHDVNPYDKTNWLEWIMAKKMGLHL